MRRYPDDMYVDLPTMVKKTVCIVFLVCSFSLFTSLWSGFNPIHPLFALLTSVACGFFCIMAWMLEKEYPEGTPNGTPKK